MKDEHDPKGQGEGTPAIELKRREFLKTLGLIGGGLLAYSTPVVQASGLGASLQATTTVRFFDVATPAQYSINEPSVTLTLIVDGTAVPVDFQVLGNVRLNPTTDPNVSSVQILSLQFVSNDPNPLLAAGHDDGRLSASVPANTTIGQLNHLTGTLAETSFPITLTSERGGTVSSQVDPSNPTVTESQTAQKKCTKKNDVHVSATPSLLAQGTILLGMVPNVSTGTTGAA